MAYVGNSPALPELESVRRVRESRKREIIEGGPGSGPRKGMSGKPSYKIFNKSGKCEDCGDSKMLNKQGKCTNCQARFQREMNDAEDKAYGTYYGS